jgi:prophage regulatory protein
MQTFLRIDDVVRVTGLPRSTVYYRMTQGEFPKPVRIGPGRSAWVEAEIVEWQRSKIAERDGQSTAA